MAKISKISCRYLPEELVTKILLKLPAKSLIRFRTLAKYWYNLITTSDFINNHFHNNNNTHILTGQLVLSPISRKFRFTVLSDQSLTRNDDIDYPRIPRYMERVLGPVNGLFLIVIGHGDDNCLGDGRNQKYDLALLNPATRELKTIFVPQNPNGLCYCRHMFGFGFDPLTNDFNVIAFDLDLALDLELDLDSLYGPLDIEMSVYSLAKDSWKYMSSPYFSIRKLSHLLFLDFDASSSYVNGACYWLLNESFILSFDFGSQVLREINGLQDTPLSDNESLFIYKYDSLALFTITYGNTNWDRVSGIDSIDLLVMEEEGYWTKRFTLNVSLLNVLEPVGFWESKLLLETVDKPDDEFGGVSTTKTVLYDPTNDEIKELGIQPREYTYGRNRVFIYDENLVSISDFCTIPDAGQL